MGTAAPHFRAMGADVHVLVVGGPPSLTDTARELVEALEARWSRFRPTSEVSRLNELAGRPVRVSPETLTLVWRGIDGASVTARGPWVVDVGHPLRREPAAAIGLRRGAVATSSRVRRAWGPRGDRHHPIDPATGRPARTGLAAATVVAAEGWQAEVMAKAAFVAG